MPRLDSPFVKTRKHIILTELGTGKVVNRSHLLTLLRLDHRLSPRLEIDFDERLKQCVSVEAGSDGFELASLIEKHNLSHSVATSASFLNFSEDLRTLVENNAITASKQALVVANEMTKLFRLLESLKIDALFYKGVALSIRTTGTLDGRGSGDVDLLVSDADTVATSKTLMSHNFISVFRISPEKGCNWRFFSWLYKELPFSSSRVQVDLHWRLFQSGHISPSFNELYARRSTVEIFQTRVNTLSDADSLMLMCHSFVSDGCQSLKQLVDIRRLQLMVQDRFASGYSKGMNDVQRAILRFAQIAFDDCEKPLDGLTACQRRLLIEVVKRWHTPASIENQETHIVSMKMHRQALYWAAKSGYASLNVLRYLMGRVFEFKNQDFNNSRNLLWRAFRAEVWFQIRHRKAK